MSRNTMIRGLAALAGIAMATSAYGQITVAAPLTGNFEYIGQGHAGDNALVYLTNFFGVAAATNETAGFTVRYYDATGLQVGGTFLIADLVGDPTAGLCQQVPGGGNNDAIVDFGETWQVNIAGALGGSLPGAAALIGITFDDAGTPVATVNNADGTNVGGTDALDTRLQIITTRTAPTGAFFDGTGATSMMFVTYSSPTVGFVAPNTATIPLFGQQNVNGTGSPTLNSVQVAGGTGADFQFTDNNAFNSNTGLAGLVDIAAGSFVQPAGTTNVLRWTFDDTQSGLKSGRAFRVPTGGSSVHDSAGNLITNAASTGVLLQPLAVSSVSVLNDTTGLNGANFNGVLEVTMNRPLATAGNAAWWNSNGGAGSIALVNAMGSAFQLGLNPFAVSFDAATPTKVRLSIFGSNNGSMEIGPDAQQFDPFGGGASFDGTSFTLTTSEPNGGVAPTASFGATPAFQAAQNSTTTITDARAPQIVDQVIGFFNLTQDTTPDGALDGVVVPFDENITISNNSIVELNINGGVATFPVNLVNTVTGALPTAINTVQDAGTPANNVIPGTVTVVGNDNNGDGVISAREMSNSLLITYNPYAIDWDNDGQTSAGGDANEAIPDTAALGAVAVTINSKASVFVNLATNTMIPAGAGAIVDTAGNALTNDLTLPTAASPFVAPTPAVYASSDNSDGASPFPVNLCYQPGDNSPFSGPLGAPAVAGPVSDSQLLFEQDLTVGDQATNDLVRIVCGEAFAGGLSTATVTENLFSYGSAGDTFGGGDFSNGSEDFLNGNGGIPFGPLNPTVAVYRTLNATDPTLVRPGVSMTLLADPTFGRGIRDGALNQVAFTGLTLNDCSAIYIPHILDANNIVQAGVFLVPGPSGDFVERITGVATQPVDATTLQAADFTTNFGATIASVAPGAADPRRIDWVLGGAQVGIDNTMTLNYAANLASAKLVAGQAPPAGTGVPVSPVASAAADGTGANAVKKLQQPWQNATDIAVLPVVVNGLGTDGLPLPLNSKVFAFNAIPIVREITADHNNVPFAYRTDDANYNNDTTTGNNPLLFSNVYPSLNAMTNWLQGLRTEVYLSREGDNSQIFTNTKTNPFQNFGDTFTSDSVLVDTIRLNINGSRLTSISFTGAGESNTDRIKSGKVDLAWDVIRSFNGTLDNYYRFGYSWGSQPVPAGVGVVDNDTGRVDMHVSRPTSKFGASSRFDSIAKPLIFVIELPNGDRYAVSSVLAASNTNDHNGDGKIGDPILFEAEVLRANASGGSAPDGLVLNFDLRNVGSHIVNPEWNLVPLDRAMGVVSQSTSNLPVLPAGVTSANIVTYNTAQFPFASPLSAGVFWAEAGGGFNGLGAPALIGAYDGKWTNADDIGGAGGAPFSTIGLDPDLISHMAFTITTKGVQLNSGITSAVGGYGLAFFNNADLAGGSALSTFGLFEFGAKLSQAAVFASNPITSSNNRAGNGWILGTVTNPYDPASGFFGANSGSDYIISFRNMGRNPATGNTTVLIDVGSLDSGAGSNNPNDLEEVATPGSEAVFFHLVP